MGIEITIQWNIERAIHHVLSRRCRDNIMYGIVIVAANGRHWMSVIGVWSVVGFTIVTRPAFVFSSEHDDNVMYMCASVSASRSSFFRTVLRVSTSILNTLCLN